jgi:hypothetical protein
MPSYFSNPIFEKLQRETVAALRAVEIDRAERRLRALQDAVHELTLELFGFAVAAE